MSMRGSDLPDHEQRAWDAIVADLRGQVDLGPQFPQDDRVDPLADLDDHDELDDDLDDDLDDGPGFEPPPPPPLPRPADAPARFAWSALAGGPALVVMTNLLDWDTWLAGLGVALTIGGFVVLVARMDDRDDSDDGAVV